MKWNAGVLVVCGFVNGAILGAVCAAVVLPKGFLQGNDGRLQWETLVTGLAAVVVAALTVAKLNEQMRQTEKLAADQRRRRGRAAKAMLPLALSEVADYATACVKARYALEPCFQANGSFDWSKCGNTISAMTAPSLPENVLSLLKECVEFIDDTPAETITDLIRHFQIQRFRLLEDMSRLRLNDGVHLVLWATIEQGLQDAAELYARASILFPFSRGSPWQAREPNRTDIFTALSAAGCFYNLREPEALADGWERNYLYRQNMQTIGDYAL